jgi:hypothetical protein
MSNGQAEGRHKNANEKVMWMSEAAVEILCDKLVGATPLLRIRQSSEQPPRSFQWEVRQKHPGETDHPKPHWKGTGSQDNVREDPPCDGDSCEGQPKDKAYATNRHLFSSLGEVFLFNKPHSLIDLAKVRDGSQRCPHIELSDFDEDHSVDLIEFTALRENSRPFQFIQWENVNVGGEFQWRMKERELNLSTGFKWLKIKMDSPHSDELRVFVLLRATSWLMQILDRAPAFHRWHPAPAR